MTRKRMRDDVLRYSKDGMHRGTVRRHYREWRRSKGIPVRCDNSSCVFYLGPLEWNCKPLQPILDHKNGNNSDNRAQNLCFLCPNCNSQLKTQGGANKGKVENEEGGFAIRRDDGGYFMPAEAGGSYLISGPDTGEEPDKK